jgi:hypothetical protein
MVEGILFKNHAKSASSDAHKNFQIELEQMIMADLCQFFIVTDTPFLLFTLNLVTRYSYQRKNNDSDGSADKE